jgi:hypothetical protein
MLAQGNALGPGNRQPCGALKGRRLPPRIQGGEFWLGRYTRVDTPGWHLPRRWRDILDVLSRGEKPPVGLSTTRVAIRCVAR